jgi:hypothetical protein
MPSAQPVVSLLSRQWFHGIEVYTLCLGHIYLPSVIVKLTCYCLPIVVKPDVPEQLACNSVFVQEIRLRESLTARFRGDNCIPCFEMRNARSQPQTVCLRVC